MNEAGRHTEHSPDFLWILSPALARQYSLAYRSCYEDPENSLVKLRACAVILLRRLFAYHGLPLKDNLFDNLNHPNIHTYIPYHVQEKLNFLRVEGNKGAHPANTSRSYHAARRVALLGLQTAYKAAAWIYTHIHQQTNLPEFIAPCVTDSDRLYGDAVMRGDCEAQYSVGMLFKGKIKTCVSSQERENHLQDATYWLRKAATQEHAGALYQLGLLILQESERPPASELVLEAEAFIRQAAKLGDVDALYCLGRFFLEGTLDARGGVAQNHQKAFHCFAKAAKHEHLGALNQLVRMYYEGLGVKTDHHKAFEYAYKAAQAGYPSAQFKLAHLYQSGCSVEATLEQAFKWYEKSAQAGYADAQVVLFKFYSNGLHVKKNLEKALEWLHLAEAQSHPGACYYLGLAYRRGIGVPIDIARALNLFKRCLDFDRAKQYPAAELEFVEGVAWLRAQTLKAAAGRSQKGVGLTEKKAGRNDPCPCGSGKKYKKCCLYQTWKENG